MALEVHVNGEAFINVGALLSPLGVSVDGVDIEITDHVQPVFSDTYGPDVPFDEQQFLQTGNIHTALVFYEEATLAQLRAPIAGTGEGVMVEAGTLFGANGGYIRVLVTGTGAEPIWNFPFARCIGAKRVKVGTRRSIFDMTFFGVPYTGTAGSSDGAVLYNTDVVTTLMRDELEQKALGGDEEALKKLASFGPQPPAYLPKLRQQLGDKAKDGDREALVTLRKFGPFTGKYKPLKALLEQYTKDAA